MICLKIIFLSREERIIQLVQCCFPNDDIIILCKQNNTNKIVMRAILLHNIKSRQHVFQQI